MQEIGARSDESQSLGNIGEIYRYQGRFQEALDYYNRALLIQQELREPRIKAVMLNNAGAVYETIGKPSKALEYYSEALLIYQSIGFKTNKDRTSLGITLNNIGQVFLTIGLPQKALEQHKQALLILQESGDPVFEATALSNIGLVYDNLGQPQKALEYYKQALLIQQDLKKYRDGEVRIFNNIGSSYRNIGKHWKALEYYNRALSISQTIEYRAGESAALNNIGTVYSDVGQPQKALEFYKQVLSIDLLRKYPFGEARTLSNIGDVYSAISQPQKALDYYNKALLIHRSIKDRFGEVATLSSMAATYSYTEQPIAAIKKWEEAVNVTLQMRSELTRTNRSAFLRTQRRAVTGLVSVLIERSNPDSAYNWANLVTTSELADYARLLDVNVRDAEAQKALDQLNQQNQRLQPLYQRLQEKFSEDLAREIRALEEERTKQIEVNIKKFPDLAELLEITPTDITDLKASIPDGTTVVHPVLLTNIRNIPNEIAFFILTKDRLTVKKVPIDPKQLDALLSQTYAQLTNRFTGYSASLAQLYDLLIRPIEPQIQATNPKQLSIIATGRLRYLPFEALYDQKTEQYLIKKYPVNYLTRLSTRSLGSKNNGSPTAEKRVLAVGNPVPKAPLALPGSETEVQDIVKTIPGSEAMLREQATLAAFKLQALRFPWLHLATHGCFRPQGCCLGTPEECQKSPRIDLQANTILFADQKFNIADAALLGLQNVDLITLSACQTALQTNSNGEEIAGLAYLFERAGAKAVIASLWSAPDKKTQALMMQFYTNLKNGMSKSEALRQAKLSQIDSHPFFWAPFVLIGDPR
ncbi:MAG: tetratricopeptide repeat protein [Leptolyngbyaceae cyanobacterium CSU_1_3]|nr:tetratricopeptide repeat protein [Leptolyngbyaceae cyanobacterium CSU_1_3]